VAVSDLIGFEFGVEVFAGKDRAGVGTRAGVGVGTVVSESKLVISSVVIWVGTVVSRARTARLNSSAFSCIDSGTAVPVLPCHFRIFWRAVSISVRL
jgi:hypothetical protein